MDGTLIDSGDIISNTINHVRVNTGLGIMNKDYLLENINNPNINPAEFFYGTNEFSPYHTELFETYYEEHCLDTVSLYPGIKKLLNKLSSNFTMSIATNASTKFAINAVKHLGIDEYFKYIIGFDKVDKPKPDPAMLLKTMDKLNYHAKDSILIGDSHKDLLAAKSANIDCHLVNWGFSEHGDDAFYTTEELYKAIIS